MALNTKFEAYKVRREIRRSGQRFKFYRNRVNKFGEPSDDVEFVGELQGLYHEQNSTLELTADDTTRLRTEHIPMILCIYEDVRKLNLKPDDFCKINGNRYDYIGAVNIQQWDIIADLSLEVIDDARF